MGDPVHGRVGNNRIREEPLPVLYASVAGKDDRALHVSGLDHLIEVVCLYLGKWFQSKVIYDKQIRGSVCLDPPLPTVVCPASVYVPEHLSGLAVKHIVSHSAGHMPQGLGYMAFAHAHGTKQKDVLPVFDIGAVDKLLDPLCRYLGVEGKVKALKSLFLFKTGLLQPFKKTAGLSSFVFVLKQSQSRSGETGQWYK